MLSLLRLFTEVVFAMVALMGYVNASAILQDFGIANATGPFVGNYTIAGVKSNYKISG